jgi:hypothetical protein
MKKLVEGMRAGDLEDLVLPLVSVDEYESKVDDDAVVVAFYVHDHDAAHDLNRFIQKSPVTILDTDVSPAPDQQGYYLVFFELLNNDRFAENMAAILEEVSPLCRNESWQMRLRGVDRIVAFSEKAVVSHFEKQEEEARDPVGESVAAFLHPSGLERVSVRGEHLVLESYGYRQDFDIVAFGPLDRIVSEQELVVGKNDVGLLAAAAETRMDRRLGEGWSVNRVGGMSLLSRADSENALLIKEK